MANAKNQAVKTTNDKNIIVIKFIKSYTPYIKGDVAGVEKKLANKLIDGEIAEKFGKNSEVDEDVTDDDQE